MSWRNIRLFNLKSVHYIGVVVWCLQLQIMGDMMVGERGQWGRETPDIPVSVVTQSD